MVGSRKKTVSRPEEPRAGMGSWRGGSQPPPNQLEDFPSGVWGAATAEIEFAEKMWHLVTAKYILNNAQKLKAIIGLIL